MAKINETYPLGDTSKLTSEDLARILADMYRDLAVAINQKPDIIIRTTDGLATDTFLSNGTINVNTATDKVEVLTNHTSTSNVTWTPVS